MSYRSYKAGRAVGLAEAGPICDASVWVVSADGAWRLAATKELPNAQSRTTTRTSP
jgi:hypothetical protein